MIIISNSDRDQAVDFLREYSAMLRRYPSRSTRHDNRRRLALRLADKFAGKPSLISSPDTTININIKTTTLNNN